MVPRRSPDLDVVTSGSTCAGGGSKKQPDHATVYSMNVYLKVADRTLIASSTEKQNIIEIYGSPKP